MIWTDMAAVDPGGRVVNPKYLRTMYTAYRRYPLDKLFETSLAVGKSRLYFGDIFTPMMTGNLVHTSTVLLRRSRLDEVGNFNEELQFSGEDYDFHLRTCLIGAVAFLDMPSIRYHVGRADQLTRPPLTLHVSRNFLKTITPIVENYRSRIQMSDKDINDVFAYAHGWIGREAMISGYRREARRHFRHSLGLRPMQPFLFGYLFMACLPIFIYTGLRAAYRRIKTLFRSA